MKLYVPACGDRVKLEVDWTFPVYLERRNVKFAQHRGLVKDGEIRDSKWIWDIHENPTAPYHERKLARRSLTLRTGTVLEIDRVYVRQTSKDGAHQGAENDYDSITFRVVGEKHNRFWVKLADANTIECELESTFKQRIATSK